MILTQDDKGQDGSPYVVALSPETLGQEWVRTRSLLRALSGEGVSHIIRDQPLSDPLSPPPRSLALNDGMSSLRLSVCVALECVE